MAAPCFALFLFYIKLPQATLYTKAKFLLLFPETSADNRKVFKYFQTAGLDIPNTCVPHILDRGLHIFLFFLYRAMLFLLRVCLVITGATRYRQHIFNVLHYGDVICSFCCLSARGRRGGCRVTVNTADVGRMSLWK